MVEIALAIVVVSLPGLKSLVQRSSSSTSSVEDGVVQIGHKGLNKEEKK